MIRLGKILCYPLLFCLFLAGFFHPNTALTQDLGRHILLGEMIVKNLTVPNTNLFSYTHPDFPFSNHHYFSEVIFYLINTYAGMVSLSYVTLFVILLACLLVFLKGKKNAQFFSLVLVSILLLRILFERTDVRPEIFSYLFLSVFVVSLYSYKNRFSKIILFLIPLSFLWVQTHIYFFIGLVLIGLFLFDGLITHRKHPFDRYNTLLFLTLLGSILVSLINPNGLSGLMYPLQVFENYGYSIEENQSVFLLQSLGFQKPSLPYFQLSAILLFIALSFSYKKTSPIDWLLAIVFSYLGFSAVRNLPLFAFVCFIPFVHALSVSQTQLATHFPRLKQEKIKMFVLVGLIGILIWQILNVSQIRGLGISVEDPYKPATDFFLAQDLPGPIFNNFDSGSYLIYTLYPKHKVFVDGRPEAYPKEFLQNIYIPMQENPEVFENIQKKYNFQSIIFSHTDQTPWAETFIKEIFSNDEWVPIFLDSSIFILVKNVPQNSSYIKSFGINNQSLKFSDNTNDFTQLIQQARFANLIQHTRLEKESYAKLLQQDPTFCPALVNMAMILSQENSPLSPFYVSRAQASCQ